MRARLLNGSSPIPRVGVPSGGGDVALGTIQFFEADPGSAWLKCDGRAYTPTSHPALYGTIPANLSQPARLSGSTGGLDVQPVVVLATPASFGVFLAQITNSGSLGNISYATGVNQSFSPTGTGLTRAKVVNGLYFAFPNSGRIARSSVGVGYDNQWELITLAGDARTVYDVAYGNGLYVAVGAQGTVWTSTTGNSGTWTQRSTPTTSALYGIAFGLGLFVAVGQDGALVTSPDGVSWTNRARPSGGQIYGIAFGNGCFSTGGASAVAFNNSTDGINWNTSSFDAGTSGVCYNVKFNCGMFIATRQQTLITTSLDGKNWSKGPDLSSGVYNIAVDADIASDGTFAGAAYYSGGQALIFYKGSVLSTPIISNGLTQKGKLFTPYMRAA